MTWSEFSQNLLEAPSNDPATLASVMRQRLSNIPESNKNCIDSTITTAEWLGLFSSEIAYDDQASVPHEDVLAMFCALVNVKLAYAPGERDVMIIHNSAEVLLANGQTTTCTSTLIEYGLAGKETGISKTTGITAAVIADLILKGEIHVNGVFTPAHPSVFSKAFPVLRERCGLTIKLDFGTCGTCPYAHNQCHSYTHKMFADGKTLYLHNCIPPGIKIAETGKYGKGLFATRDFKHGEVVYHAQYTESTCEYDELVYKHPDGDFIVHMDLDNHSVFDPTRGTREFFGFEAFINHNCDPNTMYANEYEGDRGGCYDHVALRDIHAGEEITCDFDCHNFDCRSKSLDPCLCGSSQCRGRVRGAMFLTPLDFARLSPRMNPEMREFLVQKYFNESR